MSLRQRIAVRGATGSEAATGESTERTWYASQLRHYASRLETAGRDKASVLWTCSPGEMRLHVSRSLRRVPSAGGAFPLRPHQIEAVAELSDHIGDVSVRPIGIVVIPTAGGKTEIFARSIRAMGYATPSGRVTPRTLLVVPTLDLIDQTLLRLRDAAPDLDVGVVNGQEKRVTTATITTYASFMQMAESGDLVPDDVDCIVLDEAHRALSDLRQELLTPFLDRAVVMAFTASPKFDEEKNIHSFLGAENEVFRATDERLRNEKVIAPVVNYIIRIDMVGEPPSDRIEFQRMRDAASARVFADFLREHVDPMNGERLFDRRLFGFARSVAHARKTADYLNANLALPRPAAAVSSRDGRAGVIEKLSAFRNGDLSILMNRYLLAEGIDVPDAGGVVGLAPTYSLVLQLQRGGRCRRRNPLLDPDDPAQIGMVVEFAYSLNGRMLDPGQVFYCQAIDDLSVARVVTARPVDLALLRASRFEGEPDPELGVAPLQPPVAPPVFRSADSDFVGSFSISYDMIDVTYLLDEVGHLPPLDDDSLTMTDLARALFLRSTDAGFAAFKRRLDEATLADIPLFTPHGEIRGRFMRDGNRRVLAVDGSSVETIAAHLNIEGLSLPLWSPEYLTRSDVVARYGSRSDLPEAWRRMIDASRGGLAPIRAGFMRKNYHVGFFLHEDDVGAFDLRFGEGELVDPPPPKGDDVMWSDFLALVRTSKESSPEVREIFAELEATWKESGTACYAGEAFEGGIKLSHKQKIFCIPKAEAARLAAMIGHIVGGHRSIDGDDMLYSDLARELRLDTENPALETFWAEMEAAAVSGGAVAISGGSVRGETVISGTRRATVVSRRDLSLLAAHFGREMDLPEWNAEFLTARETAKRFSMSPDNPVFVAAWSALTTADDRMGLRAGRMRKRNVVTFFLHREDVGAFDALFAGAALRPPPTKGPGDLAAHEMAARIGVSYGKGGAQPYFDGLIALAKAGQPVVVGDREVSCAPRKSRSRTPWCFREEDVPAFERQLGRKFSDRTGQYLIYNDACVAIGCSTRGNKRLREIWDACEPAWSESRPATIEGAVISGRMVGSKAGGYVACISRGSLAEFARLGGMPSGPSLRLSP